MANPQQVGWYGAKFSNISFNKVLIARALMASEFDLRVEEATENDGDHIIVWFQSKQKRDKARKALNGFKPVGGSHTIIKVAEVTGTPGLEYRPIIKQTPKHWKVKSSLDELILASEEGPDLSPKQAIPYQSDDEVRPMSNLQILNILVLISPTIRGPLISAKRVLLLQSRM